MTTPTKPAMTPLPVLTEERVRYIRDRGIEHRNLGYNNAENEATIALADHWLRTQAGWVAWKPGDAMPPMAIYLVTLDDNFLAICPADCFEEEFVIAYWSEPLPTPFAPPQEPA